MGDAFLIRPSQHQLILYGVARQVLWERVRPQWWSTPIFWPRRGVILKRPGGPDTEYPCTSETGEIEIVDPDIYGTASKAKQETVIITLAYGLWSTRTIWVFDELNVKAEEK